MITYRKLEKDNIYDLLVKEVKIEGDKAYYVVVANGKEYFVKQFGFQKQEAVPELISCLAKQTLEGTLYLVQNLAPIFQKLYSVGEIYPFQVKADMTDAPNGYYELMDRNGLIFWLQYYGNAKLSVYQQIECRVKSLKGRKIVLELVQRMEDDSPQFMFLEEMLQAVDMPDFVVRWLKNCFWKVALFAEAKDSFLANDKRWVMVTVGLLQKHSLVWLRPGGKWNKLLLDLYHRTCLYLMEDAGLLNEYTQKEQHLYTQLLSGAINAANMYQEAMRLIASGEQEEYVDTLFAKMKKSIFLYHAEERLNILMRLCSLDKELLEQKIESCFDVLFTGNCQNWMSEPYHSAFVTLLGWYIDKNHVRFDHTGIIEGEEEERTLERIVRALAIQLLLAEEDGSSDKKLRRCMLYRYLTFLKGSSPDILLEKAFATLTGTAPQKLEFGWGDVKELTMLVIRMSHPFLAGEVSSALAVQSYEGRNVQLRIVEGAVQLLPTGGVRNVRACLPDWMLPWHQLQILQTNIASRGITREAKELVVYQKMWKEVEMALFSSPGTVVHKREKRKIKPDLGDKVMIRVLHQDPQNRNCFFCRIEDEVYEGEGILNLHNVVRYNLNADISAFRSVDGKPYLLQAEVLNMDKGEFCYFNLLRLLGTFVYQGIYAGDSVQCVITENVNGIYSCVCSFGFSVQVPHEAGMPELGPGDYIEAKVMETYTYGTVVAEFVRQVMPTFCLADAFANFILSYADEWVYEADKEESPKDGERMEDAHVYELMHIIDRVAIQEEDYIKTYNYLGFARMLATLLNNKDQAGYYAEQMRMLQMLQSFVINGQVDVEKLKKCDYMCRSVFSDYPLIQVGLLELKVLASVGYPIQNSFLWRMAQQSGNERRQKLSKLALAYNLLDGVMLYKQRETILYGIDEVLNIDIGKVTLYNFGREDQHTEFKTSVVYPTDNKMRPDLQKQTKEIMSIICGFSNADGGTLYLGVNNEGFASGLDEDIEYFQGSLDHFDLHIRNSVVQYLGTEVNAGITVSYPPAGNKVVYAMKIKACPHPVKCKKTYYQRQGSSTWPLLDGALDAFLQSRERQSGRTKEKADIQLVETPPLPQPEAVSAPTIQPPVPDASEVAKVSVEKHPEVEEIKTSLIRPNAIHSWNEGYGIGTVRYLHLLSGNGYFMTEGECWRNDVVLSLAINENEADGFLVMVFESGSVLRIAMNELLDKKLEKEYKRYGQEKVIFACPAPKDSAILTVMSDVQHRPSYRLDDVKNVKSGNMLAKGEHLSVVATTGVLLCDIVSAGQIERLKRIHNLKSTQIGVNLNVYWGGNELQELEAMGIEINQES